MAHAHGRDPRYLKGHTPEENAMDNLNSAQDGKWAGGVHVGALVLALVTSWSAGVGGMVAAFVVWLIKKDESAFIRRHAAEAFNFNFSMFIYTLVGVFFSLVTLGLGLIVTVPIAVVLAVVWIWCTVQGAMAGFDGRDYRYPVTMRLLS
ncbi:hypothetical protein GCM10010960_03740 [Arenimonas maotaiensis]|uniref:DUF4870 domain-containing protein n=2 Tax=Arenimonas maotaiensis TaxID=1446479 RepID=A0A917FI78_9GAMM|nr:hypothetical protein GCM10010960_03740 [Arenimonas maotaiensis]